MNAEINIDKIILRKWDLADTPGLAEFANNKKIADNLRDRFPYPYTLRDANNFIQAATNDDSSARLLAIDLEGRAIGSIGAIFKEDVYRLNVEIGYWLAEEYWGYGIATKAILLITEYIFDNYDAIRIFAESFADNIGSQKALEKAGYVLEGRFSKNIIKNGIVKDSLIYSLLREKYEVRMPD